MLCFRLDAGEGGRGLEEKREGEEGEGKGRRRGVIVTFEVKEKGRFKSSVGANVGTQSGDMVLPAKNEVF